MTEKSATLGRLWSRYLKLRRELASSDIEGEARREIERDAGQLRDRLVVNYSPLVKYVASRIGARRATGVVGQEDMISWGVLGLLDAIETYDPDRRTKFESYAISKIRWSILDELRSQDWVPRRVRLRAQEIEAAKSRLSQELRRPPTEVEVADELEMSLSDYRSFLKQYSRAQVTSLEARLSIGEEGGAGLDYVAIIEDTSTVDPQSQTSFEELRKHLTEAISELEERERIIATFYFYEGLTLKEIGKALGLTEGRISQILRRALAKLRERLKGSTITSGGWQEHLDKV